MFGFYAIWGIGVREEFAEVRVQTIEIQCRALLIEIISVIKILI